MRKIQMIWFLTVIAVLLLENGNGKGRLTEREHAFQDIHADKERIVAADDGPGFDTVRIGDQVWMTENLSVSGFRNGDTIPQIMSDEEWEQTYITHQPGWRYCDGIPANGKLYNWYAVNDPRGLAPTGWHISTEEEWDRLVEVLGGADKAGPAMKATDEWSSCESTNESGFSALPGGYLMDNGYCEDFYYAGYWWTSAGSDDPIEARCRWLRYDDDVLHEGRLSMSCGLAVRCVKD